MKINRLLTVLALTSLVWSCAKEQVFEPIVENGEELIPLNIDGSINQEATKATAAGFVDKDAVGLYAVNYLENNTIAGTLVNEGNQADNVKYIFDEPNYKWNPVRPVYYKNVNTNVDLYLYYPYQGEISDVNEANFEVKKDQSAAATSTSLSGYEASDWLWGKAENITPSESRVQVPLSHKMAGVQVTLNEGNGFDEGEYASLEKGVILTNTTRKATIDYSNGSVTPVGSPQLDGIVMCPQVDGTFRAVVIPQTVAAGTQLFAITVDGISYSFKQSENVSYQQGKMLNVTINIKKKTPAGDYELELAESQIVDWTEDRNSHGGEARQYFVMNVETPGTLGRLIKQAGKNPDKIKNLKVTGTVTTEDFYFMRDSMAILEAVNMKECRIVNGAYYYLNENGSFCKEYKDNVIPYHAFRSKKTLYSFVFPENLKAIGSGSFYDTNLSGPLSIPNDLIIIVAGAFGNTHISSIQFNDKLEEIGNESFYHCSNLQGSLLMPHTVKSIGRYAFYGCVQLSGQLVLPNSLEKIGDFAFYQAGTHTGNLRIPDKVKSIPSSCFSGSSFTGSLDIANVTTIASSAFSGCSFSGKLTINDDVTEISDQAFSGNNFMDLKLPSNIKTIGHEAFSCNLFMEEVVIPEGCVNIGDRAFVDCKFIPSFVIPSTVISIGSQAFYRCYGVTRMTSNAAEPPYVGSGAFDGVGKDNFTLEVPPQSVLRYQTTDGWSDFKRISAHYDFSLSRRLYRVLNASVSREFKLRAPAEMEWSIESKPDWVSVSPDHGTGNTTVTVTIDEMARTTDTFDSEIWKKGAYQETQTYTGRAGEVIFLLNEKDYRFTLNVEQYDYDYGDGDTFAELQAGTGNGVDLVFMGDGYDAREIADGTYLQQMQEAIGHFFNVEPYSTYKDYFNAHIVFARSEESGIETVNTIVENKFGAYLPSRIELQRLDDVFVYAKKAPIRDLNHTTAIVLVNSSIYEGVTYMYDDGSAVAVCPVSQNAYPYDFRGIIQHEAGGHGFGKLGDEYIYHNAYIESCYLCGDATQPVRRAKANGWYRNLELTEDWNEVGWSHLIFNPSYSDIVDVYEGSYMHTRHIWRSETISCMNNNIPYFSTISRQAIVERIMDYAGEEFTLEKFYAKDSRTVGPKSAPQSKPLSKFPVPTLPVHSHEHGPIFMGEHPNV